MRTLILIQFSCAIEINFLYHMRKTWKVNSDDFSQQFTKAVCECNFLGTTMCFK